MICRTSRFFVSLEMGSPMGLRLNLLKTSSHRGGWDKDHAGQDQKGGDGENDGSGRKTSDRYRKGNA